MNSITKNRILIMACLFGLLAVILGAFGAHALKASLGADQLTSYHTGVRYQFYHALVLLFLAAEYGRDGHRFIRPAVVFFVLGVLCFSGSIYLLSTRSITGIGSSWLGPVTPVGGLFLICGWMLLLFGYIRLSLRTKARADESQNLS